MARSVGKWRLASSEHFVDLLKACGAPEDKLQRAKVFEVVGDKGVTEEFYYDGKEFGRRIYKPDGSLFSEKAMAVGVETDTESLDDRPIKVKVTVVNDSKVIREEVGPNYNVTITSEVNASGNEIHQTLVGGGVTSKRTLVKA